MRARFLISGSGNYCSCHFLPLNCTTMESFADACLFPALRPVANKGAAPPGLCIYETIRYPSTGIIPGSSLTVTTLHASGTVSISRGTRLAGFDFRCLAAKTDARPEPAVLDEDGSLPVPGSQTGHDTVFADWLATLRMRITRFPIRMIFIPESHTALVCPFGSNCYVQPGLTVTERLDQQPERRYRMVPAVNYFHGLRQTLRYRYRLQPPVYRRINPWLKSSRCRIDIPLKAGHLFIAMIIFSMGVELGSINQWRGVMPIAYC